MTQHAFGGDWTEEKLERVRKYLAAYTRLLKGNQGARKKFKIIYVDAFAGTGYRSKKKRKAYPILSLFEELKEEHEHEAFTKGSARVALEINPPFDFYLFIENDSEYANELDRLKTEYPEKADGIKIVGENANTYLKKWCARPLWGKFRAVVFLDPYGMQVEWSLIEAIAKTQAMDLWILFPLGVAVNRLLTKNEEPPKAWSEALTRIFGTDEWDKAFYKQKTDLTILGELESTTKVADLEAIGRFFVDRLRTIFPFVADNPLPLRNSTNNPLYLLCFAAGNPNGGPTAVKIAEHILRR